jgi:uncharacterized membrane protein
MSAITTPWGGTTRPAGFRFGRETGSEGGEWVVQWLLKRNCSMSPRQVLSCYACVSFLSLGIALFFWAYGARLVMPFAWLEVAALGVALLCWSRHATDAEVIRLQDGKLTVECSCGRHVDRVEFRPDWVQIEAARSDGRLIELRGEGRCIAIGRHVRPELRRALADELRWALRRAPGVQA